MDQEIIDNAVEAILAGKLVGIPTETVYGVAADATNDSAVAKIFDAKQRPIFNPLICHINDLSMARQFGKFDESAQLLARTFWPGPLTIVLPRKINSPISLLASAGLNSIALRVPAHPLTGNLISKVGRPLAAPSANISGFISPTTAAHVTQGIGKKLAAIIDGGPTPVGIESTIVKCINGDVFLLRPGGLSRLKIEATLGKQLLTPKNVAIEERSIESPGMLKSHYAPHSPLRKDITKPEKNEAFLAFGQNKPNHPHTLNLSERSDLTEAAANLFAFLRQLDNKCQTNNLAGIAVSPIPMEGLGEAINDRLTRAAADRTHIF